MHWFVIVTVLLSNGTTAEQKYGPLESVSQCEMYAKGALKADRKLGFAVVGYSCAGTTR